MAGCWIKPGAMANSDRMRGTGVMEPGNSEGQKCCITGVSSNLAVRQNLYSEKLKIDYQWFINTSASNTVRNWPFSAMQAVHSYKLL
jgi:hypothetical protein